MLMPLRLLFDDSIALQALRYALPANEKLTDVQRQSELRDFVSGKYGASLPKSSILQRNPALAIRADLHDSELFDRLLHAQEHTFSVMGLQELATGQGFRIAALSPEAAYQPDWTVFPTVQSRQSYMANRVRQRPMIEQFHFSELMTSLPIHHSCLLVQENMIPGAGLEQFRDRKLQRRKDTQWRSKHAVVMTPPVQIQFLPETITQIKQAIGNGQLLDLQFPYFNKHKGTAHVPIPRLSFRFVEVVHEHKRIRVDELISMVFREVQGWGTRPPTSEEVAKEFFDWLDAAEAIEDAVCEKAQPAPTTVAQPPVPYSSTHTRLDL